MRPRLEEMSSQKLNDCPKVSHPDHFSTQTKDIHVVVLDALMGGEDVMDSAARTPANLFAAIRSHAAAAEHHSAFTSLGAALATAGR